MSGTKRGWWPHPDAHIRADLSPVEPGRVVGVGALCDLAPHRSEQQPGSVSFSVSEFVTLEDGRRVILHEDRGWTSSPVTSVRWGPLLDARPYEDLPAVDAGRRIAKAAPDGGQLVIKKENGRIQTEHTYKKDPHPPKG